jgi:hypothetical protein
MTHFSPIAEPFHTVDVMRQRDILEACSIRGGFAYRSSFRTGNTRLANVPSTPDIGGCMGSHAIAPLGIESLTNSIRLRNPGYCAILLTHRP